MSHTLDATLLQQRGGGLRGKTPSVEIVAGWWFNSMALLADVWHMSSHAIAIGLSAFAYAAARRYSRDSRFAFIRTTVRSRLVGCLLDRDVLVPRFPRRAEGTEDALRMKSGGALHIPNSSLCTGLDLFFYRVQLDAIQCRFERMQALENRD